MKQLTLTATVRREGDSFVAQCIEFDVSSFGPTESEAIESLKEAVTLFLEPPTAAHLPTLHAFQIELPSAS